ncbi:hypothetical protein GCM10007852_02150 [Agaribacter marinus]|uniref:Uncharacterized protein n=1 Tax=Agaribacter marinus TaxID=1431249 RepID=A0AA37SUC6_9ALTE|nr:hypothetical protein GCM10007852_02150 [Agaribacter marinus]
MSKKFKFFILCGLVAIVFLGFYQYETSYAILFAVTFSLCLTADSRDKEELSDRIDQLNQKIQKLEKSIENRSDG